MRKHEMESVVTWRRTYAMFGIHGDFTSRDEITNLFDISPSRGFGKGEEYVGHIDRDTKGKRIRPVGMWALHSIPSVTSNTPEDHISFLLDILEPKAMMIRKLQSKNGYTVGLWLHYAVPIGTMGYSLQSSILRRVCAICKQVTFQYDLIQDDDKVD